MCPHQLCTCCCKGTPKRNRILTYIDNYKAIDGASKTYRVALIVARARVLHTWQCIKAIQQCVKAMHQGSNSTQYTQASPEADGKPTTACLHSPRCSVACPKCTALLPMPTAPTPTISCAQFPTCAVHSDHILTPKARPTPASFANNYSTSL